MKGRDSGLKTQLLGDVEFDGAEEVRLHLVQLMTGVRIQLRSVGGGMLIQCLHQTERVLKLNFVCAGASAVGGREMEKQKRKSNFNSR